MINKKVKYGELLEINEKQNVAYVLIQNTVYKLDLKCVYESATEAFNQLKLL